MSDNAPHESDAANEAAQRELLARLRTLMGNLKDVEQRAGELVRRSTGMMQTRNAVRNLQLGRNPQFEALQQTEQRTQQQAADDILKMQMQVEAAFNVQAERLAEQESALAKSQEKTGPVGIRYDRVVAEETAIQAEIKAFQTWAEASRRRWLSQRPSLKG